MKAVILICATLFFANDQGYSIKGDTITFRYAKGGTGMEVIVSGNFNGWSKDANWLMKYKEGEGYELSVPISMVREPNQTFYEFTFRVNGKLLDAPSNAPNVIHCAGYGSRYVIRF
ncbi:MAG: hypothetical protein AB7O48_06430 [Cyclobacteriaceae bacterium]